MAAQSADSISIAASMFAGYTSDYEIKKSKKYIEESKANISILNSKIKDFKDKLNDLSLKNEIVEYRTIIQFRSKNAFGALVLNTANARFDKNLEVLDFSLN
jgi:NH3-dependent NAD+ synthetase